MTHPGHQAEVYLTYNFTKLSAPQFHSSITHTHDLKPTVENAVTEKRYHPQVIHESATILERDVDRGATAKNRETGNQIYVLCGALYGVLAWYGGAMDFLSGRDGGGGGVMVQ